MTAQTGIKSFLNNLCQGSKGIWWVVGILYLISFVSVYGSLESIRGYNYWGQYLSHVSSMALALAVMLVLHRLPPKPIISLLFVFGIVFFFLVLICPIFGASINGAKRTIFGIQPSDCIKPCLIVFSAMCLAGGMSMKNEGKGFSWSKGNIFKLTPPKWLWVVVCSLVCGCVALENGSQAVMIGFTLFCIAMLAGVPLKHFAIYFGMIFGLVAFIAAVFMIQLDDKGHSQLGIFQKGALHRCETWYHRIQNAGDADSNPIGPDFDFMKDEQANHGKVAVAQSKGWGRGVIGNTERSVLPLAFSDFIFASIVEMSGVIGAVIILLLYGSLFFITIRWAMKTESPRNALILFGSGAMITIQALVNMLVGSGAFVTGQPLPFVSKGGQSMLVCAVMIALVQSVIKTEMDKKDENKKVKVKVAKAEEAE